MLTATDKLFSEQLNRSVNSVGCISGRHRLWPKMHIVYVSV